MKIAPTARPKKEALSRDRIIDTSIELLDFGGEEGLTFPALSKRLATGPGAIYWYVNNKTDLLISACDAVISRTIVSRPPCPTPQATIVDLASALFDVMNEHPWIGSALSQAAGKMPVVRIFECLGQQLQAMGLKEDQQWSAASAMISYILGVGSQNAANSELARRQGLDRSRYLGQLSKEWSELEGESYPFTRLMAKTLQSHDDKADFLAGVDFLLIGLLRRSE